MTEYNRCYLQDFANEEHGLDWQEHETEDGIYMELELPE